MKQSCLNCTAVFMLSIGSLFSATYSTAAIVQNPSNGHFYELVLTGGITWDQANDAANARPGNWYLATITDATENAFIESLLAPGTPYFEENCLSSNLVGRVCNGIWLGGTSSSNASQDWSWVTGEVWSFTDWGPTAPFGNGDRLQIVEFRDQGPLIAWNDVPGTRTSSTGYIVETNVIPIPAAVWLFSSGFIGLIGVARKRKA